MRRLNVLILPHPLTHLRAPWGRDVIEVCGRHHQVAIFDRAEPAAAQFEGIDAIVDIGGQATREEIGLAGRAGVRYMQVQTTGLDHVHVDAIGAAGMMLAHCPGTLSAPALAEHAMLFILGLAHRLGESQANFRSRVSYVPTGGELGGKTLGVVGFGSSGMELARRARAFGMRIMAIDVRPIDQTILDEIRPQFMGTPDELDHVVTESDYLSLHVHLTDETRHLIDARRIAMMKPTACLINVARGGLVDETALHRALADGRLGGAGLDVFADEPPDPALPVFQLPNVVVTPHTAGSTEGTSRRRAAFAAENLDRYARGQEPLGRVRMPSMGG